MKLILLFFIVIFFTTHIFSQIPPFKISGNEPLQLSNTYFMKGMKGSARILLVIDRQCNILNYALIRVSVSDDDKNNIFYFWNEEVFKTISANPFVKLEKNIYPLYIHSFFEILSAHLRNLKISLSQNTSELKDINEISFLIKIE